MIEQKQRGVKKKHAFGGEGTVTHKVNKTRGKKSRERRAAHWEIKVSCQGVRKKKALKTERGKGVAEGPRKK